MVILAAYIVGGLYTRWKYYAALFSNCCSAVHRKDARICFNTENTNDESQNRYDR